MIRGKHKHFAGSRGVVRSAMTYVELLISFAILGTAVAASLQAIGGYAAGAQTAQKRGVALELANQLMAEINTQPFADSAGGTTLGIDAGENPANRATFDDIDDYNGYTESPPTDRTTGEPLEDPLTGKPLYVGYRRSVSVTYDTALATRTGASLPGTAFKRITVVVSKDEAELVRLATVRSANHAED